MPQPPVTERNESLGSGISKLNENRGQGESTLVLILVSGFSDID